MTTDNNVIRTTSRFYGHYDRSNGAIMGGQFDARSVNTFFAVIDELHPRGHSGIDVRFSYREPLHNPGPKGKVFWVQAGDREWGLAVIIHYPNNLASLFLHFDEIAPGIVAGEEVEEGQLLGYAGATGEAYAYMNGAWVRGGPEATHLHWMCGPTDANPWMNNQRELWNPLELLEDVPLHTNDIVKYLNNGGMWVNRGPSPDIANAQIVQIVLPFQDEPGPSVLLNSAGAN